MSGGRDSETGERKVALIHRVILPDDKSPKEYAVLITDRRTIFILQKKTRSTFVLRGEIRYGTALVTDVAPKTIDDFDSVNVESLMSNPTNIAVNHDQVVSLTVGNETPDFRPFDLFVRLTMKMQKEVFQVYSFALTYRQNPGNESTLVFYIVPLGPGSSPEDRLRPGKRFYESTLQKGYRHSKGFSRRGEF